MRLLRSIGLLSVFGPGYLEVLAQHRMSDDSHFRVFASGRLKTLAAPAESYMYGPDATDEGKPRWSVSTSSTTDDSMPSSETSVYCPCLERTSPLTGSTSILARAASPIR